MGPGKPKDNRRIHAAGQIKTVELAAPVRFLPSGRGPVVQAVPAARGGLIGEAVLAELKQRGERESTTERSSR